MFVSTSQKLWPISFSYKNEEQVRLERKHLPSPEEERGQESLYNWLAKKWGLFGTEVKMFPDTTSQCGFN